MTITTGMHIISDYSDKKKNKSVSCDILAKEYMKCIETCYSNWGNNIECDSIRNKFNSCLSTKKNRSYNHFF